MNNTIIYTIIVIVLLTTFSHSQTYLSGDISSMTLSKLGSPYIITKDIFISGGEETIIKAGTALLFKPYTGLTVFGSLFVEGGIDDPVIFTSIDDTSFNKNVEKNPEPFDWNGIAIEKNAESIKLRYFILAYSVYGVQSQKNDIVLKSGIFKQNGQYNFTINDKVIIIPEELPYSYYNYIEPPPHKTFPTNNDTIHLAKNQKQYNKKRKLQTGIKIILGTCITSGITSTAFFIASAKNKNWYNEEKIDEHKLIEYKNNYLTYGNVGVYTAIYTGISLCTSFIFAIINNHNSPNVNESKVQVFITCPKKDILAYSQEKRLSDIGFNILWNF